MKMQMQSTSVRSSSSSLLENVSSNLFADQQFIRLGHIGSTTNRSTTSLGGSIVTQTTKQAGDNHRRSHSLLGLSDHHDSQSDDNEPEAMNEEDAEALIAAKYMKAIELIVRKCESLSADNEKLIQRWVLEIGYLL